MKLYHVFFYCLIFTLLVYSYVLVDPNITFINNPIWTDVRNILVNFGYYQRDSSSVIFLLIIISLFFSYFYFVNNYKQVSLFKLILPLSILAIFSYPLLSHDFFNYMFDAKIVTFYHQNPYILRALDFPQDPWIRFMHWTHRTYPYGPTFLLITLVPSFLSFGKFILSFIFFKITFFLLYITAVYLLNKLNKKWAVIFAFNPLVIVEGLVSSHNDLIGVSLAIIGIYFVIKRRGLLGRSVLLVSGGIKYITLPLVLLIKPIVGTSRDRPLQVLICLILILGYLSFKSEIQPWYFLALFAFLPFYEKFISNLNIFFAGLLFSYYPYIRFGEWSRVSNIDMKHYIIVCFLTINVMLFLIKYILLKTKNTS